jgi:hypothetical protein
MHCLFPRRNFIIVVSMVDDAHVAAEARQCRVGRSSAYTWMMAWTTTATGAGGVGSAGEEATGRACRLVDPEVQRAGHDLLGAWPSGWSGRAC